MSQTAQSAILDDDPLWYKDAVIYELHIRAFGDSNGDGIGDLNGLIERLDYVADLGATAIWVLPFYPSPLKDGGYDIADYTGIHESYGTRRDFARLLREAHKRGLRVITELVMNHTSSDHPWFQRARRAPPGSRYRNYYVWSDSAAKYDGVRIIFQDFETSNWTWDPVAKAYYWHRFYSHQPDLNFDNPEVQQAMLEVVDFWLEMGVDGLRLDAVPYLYEREGTTCENLPETHAFLKSLRAHIDAKFKNRMLLAEANMWPADAAAYFGEGKGDECHMNFHFPLMPRMFMAIQLEDSFPIVNILRQTPRIPETAQWATFLRNHDELTLEMVTDEDRDTMVRAYASERNARINLGIRRRLAPLLKVRRKIELMNALLLSLPGTPVIYYGDEIGMGDNIYLGDRDGVRTPMQWSGDRNAGFSRANPQKLYLPVIVDPEYHYEAINVEAQQQNSSSLLWWMKRIIAKRKQSRVFGRGSIDFMPVSNGRVLAYVREHEDMAVLVVANLSRFAQCAEVDLSRFEHAIPVEMFGQARFPEITKKPYFFSMSPHSFFWFVLERAHGDSAEVGSTLPSFEVAGSWTSVLAPKQRAKLVSALVAHAAGRRWFRGKARGRKGAEIRDVIRLTGALPSGKKEEFALVLLEVDYDEGDPEIYAIPLGFAVDRADIERASSTGSTVASLVVKEPGEEGLAAEGTLFDAVISPRFATALLATVRSRKANPGEAGEIAGVTYKLLKDLPQDADLTPHPLASEQSNSTILYGKHLVLKLLRVVDEGVSVELEMSRYLSSLNGFRGVARLAGALEHKDRNRTASTLATVHELVPNQGEAWQLTLDSLDRYFERLLSTEHRPAEPPARPATLLAGTGTIGPEVAEWVGTSLDRAKLLGKRTAELHLALAKEQKDPAFTPEAFTRMHQQSLYQSAHNLLTRTFEAVRKKVAKDPELGAGLAKEVLAAEEVLGQKLAEITGHRIAVDRIRCHGDYHLGQVLWTGDDFVIIDFEGEPARPLTQRRFKRCPLRDVAGMVRSFHYAGAAALRRGRLRPEDIAVLRPWAAAWYDWVAAAFVESYLATAKGAAFLPKGEKDIAILLDFYIAEKCVYEVGYELNNRPDWLEIPLRGLLHLCGSAGDKQ
ncbi:MAG: maltose alpha-D-glucosyltransferase [Polyangiaceae bacterium]